MKKIIVTLSLCFLVLSCKNNADDNKNDDLKYLDIKNKNLSLKVSSLTANNTKSAFLVDAPDLKSTSTQDDINKLFKNGSVTVLGIAGAFPPEPLKVYLTNSDNYSDNYMDVKDIFKGMCQSDSNCLKHASLKISNNGKIENGSIDIQIIDADSIKKILSDSIPLKNETNENIATYGRAFLSQNEIFKTLKKCEDYKNLFLIRGTSFSTDVKIELSNSKSTINNIIFKDLKIDKIKGKIKLDK